MATENFIEQALNKLSVASNSGDAESINGTRLIGHRPDIAPRAYVHVLYKGLKGEELDILESRLGYSLPECLKELYKCINGMMIYLGSIRFLGYVPQDAKHVGVHEAPSNILIPNVSARLNGLSSGDVVFAWYKADGSYAVLEEDLSVCQYDVKKGGSLLQRWGSFEDWLQSEIDRLQNKSL